MRYKSFSVYGANSCNQEPLAAIYRLAIYSTFILIIYAKHVKTSPLFQGGPRYFMKAVEFPLASVPEGFYLFCYH